MKKYAILFGMLACAALAFAATSPEAAALGTASISGTITDSVTGDPIAGATVSAGRCGRSATTGDDGTYTISGLPAGSYVVKAMKCGAYYPKAYPDTVVLEEGQAVTGIDIALRPMGGGGEGSISGTVYDKVTSEPIVGAKVTTGGCHGGYAITGDDGTYTIEGLADGSYTVRAMKNGYQCAAYPDPVVIENGNAVTGIDFYLVPNNNAALD